MPVMPAKKSPVPAPPAPKSQVLGGHGPAVVHASPINEKDAAKHRIMELLASIKLPNNTSSMHLAAAEEIERQLTKL